ncbi:hypothetical protein [Ruegeria sp. HKCCA6837]|uniref:hypothetical protein n=1 Tax=Ruegeria sp. HKCCA6837 TaxID=2682989 RepID=UPI001489B020|nr:hypothetical protein [Ruegeria sp. HKCCA6837]
MAERNTCQKGQRDAARRGKNHRKTDFSAPFRETGEAHKTHNIQKRVTGEQRGQ